MEYTCGKEANLRHGHIQPAAANLVWRVVQHMCLGRNEWKLVCALAVGLRPPFWMYVCCSTCEWLGRFKHSTGFTIEGKKGRKRAANRLPWLVRMGSAICACDAQQ
eukprot:756079-Pelagomonas_calceolata.AAC.9